MSRINMLEENVIKELVEFIGGRDENAVVIPVQGDDDIEMVKDLVTGIFEFAAKDLAENKSKEEKYENGFADYMGFEVTFHEGDEDNNYGVGTTIGNDFKSIVESEAETEE